MHPRSERRSAHALAHVKHLLVHGPKIGESIKAHQEKRIDTIEADSQVRDGGAGSARQHKMQRKRTLLHVSFWAE